MIPFLVIFALAMAAMSLKLAAAWAIRQRSGNSGWVDTFWTFGLGGIGAGAALIPAPGTSAARHLLIAALAALWSLRLGGYLLRRTLRMTDDPRYAQLAAQWGDDAAQKMFWFLQKQAWISAPMMLAILLAAWTPKPDLDVQDWLGAALMLVAISGEAVADRQLRAFRADPAQRGRVCDTGLWRFSRHPNYFFEWLGWLAYPVISIDLTGAYPWGLLGLAGPACMYWLLVHVSGVPPLEDHMLRSRGDAFRAYRARTNRFFPGPPRD